MTIIRLPGHIGITATLDTYKHILQPEAKSPAMDKLDLSPEKNNPSVKEG